MLGSRRAGNFRDYNVLRPDGDRHGKQNPLILKCGIAKVENVSNLVKLEPASSPIGRGGFGEVYRGRHQKKGDVALKRPFEKTSLEVIQSEIENWVGLKHSHVLEFIGTCFLENHFHLVFPFVYNKDLSDYIKRHPYMDRQRILKETADAIAYLHSVGIIHGDIKANNILIGRFEEAYISDFGLSRRAEVKTASGVKGAGCLRWQAPELHEGGQKSFETDVYAYGITIAEVLKGETPFMGLTEGQAYKAVSRGVRPEKTPLKSPTGISYRPVWDVAEQCWCHIRAERITMHGAFTALQLRNFTDAIKDRVSKSNKPLSRGPDVGTECDSLHKPPDPVPLPLPSQKPGLNKLQLQKMNPSRSEAEDKALDPSWADVVGNRLNASKMVSNPVMGSAGISPSPSLALNPVRPKPPVLRIPEPQVRSRVEASRRQAPVSTENGPPSRSPVHALAQLPDMPQDQSSTPALASGTDVVDCDLVPAHRDGKPYVDLREDGMPHPPASFPNAMKAAGGRDNQVIAKDRAAARRDGGSPPPSRKRTKKKGIDLRGGLGFNPPNHSSHIPATTISSLVVSKIYKPGVKPRSRARIGDTFDLQGGVGFYRTPQPLSTLNTPPVTFGTVSRAIERGLQRISVGTQTPSTPTNESEPSAVTPSSTDSTLETPPDIGPAGSLGFPRPLRSGTSSGHAKASSYSSEITISVQDVDPDDFQPESNNILVPNLSFDGQADQTPTQATHDAFKPLPPLRPLQQPVTGHQRKLNPHARAFFPRPLPDPSSSYGSPSQSALPPQHFQNQHTTQAQMSPYGMGMTALPHDHSPHPPLYAWVPSPYGDYHGSMMVPYMVAPPYGVSLALSPHAYGGHLPPTWQTYGPLTPAATGGSWAPIGTHLLATPQLYSRSLYPTY